MSFDPDVRVRGTYVAAGAALIVGVWCLAMVLSRTSEIGGATVGTLLASVAIAWLCLRVEHRRDRYVFFLFVGVFAGVVTLVAGAMAVLDDEMGARVRAGAIAIVSAAVAVGGGLRAAAERRRPDAIRDHLTAALGPSALLESEGVLWAVLAAEADGDLLGRVHVLVQAQVAAPRTIRVSIEDVTGWLARRGALAAGAPPPFELEPGGLACLTIPVGPGAKPAKEAHLYVHVDAAGPPGERLRKQRGAVPKRRTTRAFQLFALLGAHLVVGGGVRARMCNPSLRRGERAPEAPSWRELDDRGVESLEGVLADVLPQRIQGMG